MYRVAWKEESNASPLDCPTVYRDPVTTEYTRFRNAATHQINNDKSSQRHSDAADFVTDEPHCHAHSCQDHVKTPKVHLRKDIDALNENDGTSKPCQDRNSRHDTESITSTKVKIPSNDDGDSQHETFSHGGKNKRSHQLIQ